MTTTVTATPTGFPAWSRVAEIGDYGGSLDKRASSTEGDTPYAYQVYRELQAGRGSAYSKETGTLVHLENLAIARAVSEVYFRKPERIRANGTPASSDERLDYWIEVLGVPQRAGDQKWQLRSRCAAHYAVALGPSYQNVYDACQTLLGDNFVGLTLTVGSDMANPPDVTYWPGVNDGPSGYSLGRGAWMSTRCHLFVEVQQTPGTTARDYIDLLDVQLFQMLDRVLPAWATFSYYFSDGFQLNQDLLNFDTL